MKMLKQFLITLLIVWGFILVGVVFIFVAIWLKANTDPWTAFLLFMGLLSLPLSFIVAANWESLK